MTKEIKGVGGRCLLPSDTRIGSRPAGEQEEGKEGRKGREGGRGRIEGSKKTHLCHVVAGVDLQRFQGVLFRKPRGFALDLRQEEVRARESEAQVVKVTHRRGGEEASLIQNTPSSAFPPPPPSFPSPFLPHLARDRVDVYHVEKKAALQTFRRDHRI
jgi:hypothetical protein